MSDEEVDPDDYARPVPDMRREAWDENFAAGVRVERARIRGIVLRLFGNDWKGNQALKEIDDG